MANSFDDQWRLFKFKNASDRYNHLDYLKSISFSFFREFDGKVVVELGSGDGRIVQMLFQSGAKKVISVEPTETGRSAQIDRFANFDIELLKSLDQLKQSNLNYEILVCVGVLHHQKNPEDFLKSILSINNNQAKILIWVYSNESAFYVRCVKILRGLTSKLSTRKVKHISKLIEVCLRPYVLISNLFEWLPLSRYIRNVFSQLNHFERQLLIYDQLSPRYAHYFSKIELHELVRRNGRTKYEIHSTNGSGYSLLIYPESMSETVVREEE